MENVSAAGLSSPLDYTPLVWDVMLYVVLVPLCLLSDQADGGRGDSTGRLYP